MFVTVMKNIVKCIGGCIVVMLLMFIGIHIFTKDTNERLEQLPVIASREQLAAAMEDTAQEYVILDAPLSGGTVSDSLGILADEFIYLDYEKEEYQFERTYNSSREEYEYFYRWNRVEAPSAVVSEEYYIYDDIFLTAETYVIEDPTRINDISKMTLSGEQYFNEQRGLYYPYGDDVGSSYYPDDGDGTIRYALYGVEPQTPVSFLAVVGDGTVSAIRAEEDTIQLVVNGALEDLEYYESEASITAVMLTCIFGALLVFIIVFLLK